MTDLSAVAVKILANFWRCRFLALLLLAALVIAPESTSAVGVHRIGGDVIPAFESAPPAAAALCDIFDDGDDCSCVGGVGCHAVMIATATSPLDWRRHPPKARECDPRRDGCDIAPPIHPPRIAIPG